MRSMKKLNTLLYASVVMANTLQAQENTDLPVVYNLSLQELMQLEVTIATGNSVPIEKAPAIASVVTSAEMKAMGSRTLLEALERVPGLHITPSSLSRMDPLVSIRGIHTSVNAQVLYLINGKPISSASNGSHPINFHLPTTAIERIEVMRGPGSAVYGADAYAGVINVITKDAQGIPKVEVGSRAGSFNSRDTWLSAGTNILGMNIAANISHMKSDGDDDRIVDNDLQLILDGAGGTNASLAPGPLSTDYEVFDAHIKINNKHWDINFWNWQSKTGLGPGAAQALDPRGEDEGTARLASVNYITEDWLENWKFDLGAYYYLYETKAQLNLLPPGSVLPIGSDGNISFSAPAGVTQFTEGAIGNPSGRRENTEFDFIAIYDGWNNHRIRIATGFKHHIIDTSEAKNFGPGVITTIQPTTDGTLVDVTDTEFIYLANDSRDITYLSLQDEWEIAQDWNLVAGLRFDRYSDFGNTTNPRVSLVWSTTEKLTTKLLYGSAYRAPSFSELGFINNPVSLGNRDISPETIDTLELAFNYRPFEKLQTNLTFFQYRAQDLIEFTPDEGANTRTASNARDQDGEGFELEANIQALKNLLITTSFSMQNAEDADNNTDIHDAPQNQFTINANWEFLPQWLLHTQLNHVANRKRAAGDLRDEIDDFTVIDAHIKRSNILSRLDLSFAIRNLTDEDIREPSNGTISNDFPMESRSFWATLSYKID